MDRFCTLCMFSITILVLHYEFCYDLCWYEQMHTTNFRMANYFSRVKSNTRDCEITCHFIDKHRETWIGNYAENEELEIIGIAQLEHRPRSKDALKTRLTEFEGYWQFQLGTISPKGMNVENELKKNFNRS